MTLLQIFWEKKDSIPNNTSTTVLAFCLILSTTSTKDFAAVAVVDPKLWWETQEHSKRTSCGCIQPEMRTMKTPSPFTSNKELSRRVACDTGLHGLLVCIPASFLPRFYYFIQTIYNNCFTIFRLLMCGSVMESICYTPWILKSIIFDSNLPRSGWCDEGGPRNC